MEGARVNESQWGEDNLKNFDIFISGSDVLSPSKTGHGVFSLYDLIIVLKIFICACNYSDWKMRGHTLNREKLNYCWRRGNILT